jgi:hypothetical protein
MLPPPLLEPGPLLPPPCWGRRRARGPAGAPAARGCSRVVLCHPLRAVSQLLSPQPLISRSVAAPPHEVVQDPADLLAVEQQLHLVLALLPLVGHRARNRGVVGPRVEGFEQVHVHRRAAPHLPPARECEHVGVGARAGSVTVKGPSHLGRSLPMSAASSSSLVSSSTWSPTLNTVSTRPASSFAFRSCCAAAKS